MCVCTFRNNPIPYSLGTINSAQLKSVKTHMHRVPVSWPLEFCCRLCIESGFSNVTRMPSAKLAAQRRCSHGEVLGLDFASEESKGKPESVGQAYRASRRLRRSAAAAIVRNAAHELLVAETGKGYSSDAESEATKPESSLHCVASPTPTSTGAGLESPPAPSTGALQRRRASHGEVQGLDFPSEESKDKPGNRRLHRRRPEGSSGSDVASEATKGVKLETILISRRLRFEDIPCGEADASRTLSNRHTATYTGAPELARERASAHSAAVTAVHAAARRERADAAARRESADVAVRQRRPRAALPPRDVEWV